MLCCCFNRLWWWVCHPDPSRLLQNATPVMSHLDVSQADGRKCLHAPCSALLALQRVKPHKAGCAPAQSHAVSNTSYTRGVQSWELLRFLIANSSWCTACVSIMPSERWPAWSMPGHIQLGLCHEQHTLHKLLQGITYVCQSSTPAPHTRAPVWPYPEKCALTLSLTSTGSCRRNTGRADVMLAQLS